MLTAALARRLAALGFGTYDTDDSTIFLEQLPGQPAAAIGVFADTGQPAVRFRRPGVQVLVRGDGVNGRARSGYAVAQDILERLDGEGHVVWGEGSPDAVRVAWCLASQSQVVNLGDDDNGHPRWSVRFDVQLAGEVA